MSLWEFNIEQISKRMKWFKKHPKVFKPTQLIQVGFDILHIFLVLRPGLLQAGVVHHNNIQCKMLHYTPWSSAYLHSLTVCAVHVSCAACAKKRATDNHKAYNCSYICNLNKIFLAVLVKYRQFSRSKASPDSSFKGPDLTKSMCIRMKVHTFWCVFNQRPY